MAQDLFDLEIMTYLKLGGTSQECASYLFIRTSRLNFVILRLRYVAQATKLLRLRVKPTTNPQPLPTHRYKIDARSIGNPHPLARSVSRKIIQGRAAASTMLELKVRGFIPDLVFGHVGWGEMSAVKDVWPHTKLIVHAEFYYRSEGANINFDPEFPSDLSFDARYAVRLNNAPILLALADADWSVAPTQWQKSRFPVSLHDKIIVLHEGIDTDLLSPRPYSVFALPDGATLDSNDEVITFAARNLEPYRGFHIFMRALPGVLDR
ncbi:MAG: hypothetical protein JO211_02935, partial [Acidobacteriaceae bacterium]|nr:hypothetical protein [Acidobacteriaceae bacterium]